MEDNNDKIDICNSDNIVSKYTFIISNIEPMKNNISPASIIRSVLDDGTNRPVVIVVGVVAMINPAAFPVVDDVVNDGNILLFQYVQKFDNSLG